MIARNFLQSFNVIRNRLRQFLVDVVYRDDLVVDYLFVCVVGRYRNRLFYGNHLYGRQSANPPKQRRSLSF